MIRFLTLGFVFVVSLSGGWAFAGDTGDLASEVPTMFEDVAFTTADGIALKGSYYAAKEPGPAVLLIHMCRGDADRTIWHKLALQLSQSGIHTLTFDLRGYGESAGGEASFTTMPNFIAFWRSVGMNDVEAAYDFLAAQPGVDQDAIGVSGASCGVFMNIEAAVRHDNIRAMALLSGPFDQEAAAKLAGLNSVAVLGAASEGDTRAYEATKRVFLATDNPQSRNLQFKGDAHGTDMFGAQPDLEEIIRDWFVRHLLE